MKDIPVFINNRNRITSLKALVDWLQRSGYENITVLDNDSTYAPLIEYYQNVKDLRIRMLKRNLGPQALWHPMNEDLLDGSPFVYTDSDIVPCEECPTDAIEFFIDVAKSIGTNYKVGFGLRIDDLPGHYSQSNRVRLWESRFWENEIAKVSGTPVYNAGIDTTFAVYLGNGSFSYLGARTGAPYIARHLPWYTDSCNPTEEEKWVESKSNKSFSNWRINDCCSKTVINHEKQVKRAENLIHWTKVPMAIDMAPYAPWYQSITKNIVQALHEQPVVVVEAGVRYGCSARIFVDALKSVPHWSLHLIDPVPTEEALAVHRAYPSNVAFYKAKAEAVASKFKDRSIDLLHIDADIKGNHPYEMALEILLAFWNKLKPDGSIILHDCTSHFPTIQRLARELECSGWTSEKATPQKECPISAPCLLQRNSSITQEKFTVVIPVIGTEFLASILKDLTKSSRKPQEVIVIDNSGTNVAQRLCSSFSGLSIRYLPQKNNLGVNGAWNLGIAESTTEIVSILNDDLVLPVGFFDSILQVFESMPQAGFVVPQTVSNHRIIKNDRKLPMVSLLPYREGWAMTIRKSCVEPIPESLFTFYGDDWFYRCVQEHGFWCLKILNTTVYHYVGCSKKPDERKKMGLPDLQVERAAWQDIEAGRFKSAS